MPRCHLMDRDDVWHDIVVSGDQPLMFGLRDAGLPVEGTCGGCAACGTCHVIIEEDWVTRLPPRAPDEDDMVSQLYHFDERLSRLSCQIKVTPSLEGLRLRLAPEE